MAKGIQVCEKHHLEHFELFPPEKCDVCKLKQQIGNYKKAYNILMDYFDYIPEDDRQEVSDRLDEVGL